MNVSAAEICFMIDLKHHARRAVLTVSERGGRGFVIQVRDRYRERLVVSRTLPTKPATAAPREPHMEAARTAR
jgi:hypothetical protein